MSGKTSASGLFSSMSNSFFTPKQPEQEQKQTVNFHAPTSQAPITQPPVEIIERDTKTDAKFSIDRWQQRDKLVEQNLVNDITEPGGIRAIPTPSDLNEFCKRAIHLDMIYICDSLVKKLDEENWQAILVRSNMTSKTY